jgi:hypothetical protein
MTDIIVAEAITIREAGLDEYWLQDQIIENVERIGLGELEPIAREHRQASGGRLDILLKNPADDSMYEVEVMLGETDETHIIRTIEYWDNEKRRWPQRNHTAVLIAEHINRRFFNVIHLLSYSIPIVAIQATLLRVGDQQALSFTKILDTFQEVDDGSSLNDEVFDRDFWINKAAWTVETAEALRDTIADDQVRPELNYLKHYVALTVDGSNYLWMHKRASEKSLLGFRMASSLQDEVAQLLDRESQTYVRKPDGFRLTIDAEIVRRNPTFFREVFSFVKKHWDYGG